MWQGICSQFNGDFWHAKPVKYNESDVLNFPSRNGPVQKTALSLWESDAARLSILRSLGYTVLVIWESEYKQDKEGTIKKCLNFLNE